MEDSINDLEAIDSRENSPAPFAALHRVTRMLSGFVALIASSSRGKETL